MIVSQPTNQPGQGEIKMSNNTCPICGFVDDGYSHYADCPMLDLSESDQTQVIKLSTMDTDYLSITLHSHFRNSVPQYQHNYELMRHVGWIQ
jgi:hypothetical protein